MEKPLAPDCMVAAVNLRGHGCSEGGRAAPAAPERAGGTGTVRSGTTMVLPPTRSTMADAPSYLSTSVQTIDLFPSTFCSSRISPLPLANHRSSVNPLSR